ncbi:MAG: YHYH protein [Planctomycetia bacterium]
MSGPCGRWAWTMAVIAAAGLAPGAAEAHPWHRHRADEPDTAHDHDAETAAAVSQPADPRIILTAAPRKPASDGIDIADAFAPFEKLKAVATRRDNKWFYVESNGIPDHPLMIGIRTWQQQVPLPQKYTGDNAWQIPLQPVPAKEPASTKNRFLRGAIALAVNGIPIFNPLNNRGEDALAIGELDDYGGHCGRADDYHYHVAPLHLEKVVGKGMPIAYALDGYPVYGSTEPDGSPMKPLDACGGHEEGDGAYHYHAIDKYPYLIGAFRGEVVERDGQVDPQPRAEPVRPALGPLRGATIVGFESPAADTRKVVYEVSGRKGSVAYNVAQDGTAAFTFTDPSGRVTTETYSPRQRGPGGGPRREGGGPQQRPGPPPRPGERPPRDAGAGDPPRSQVARLAAKQIAVTSPAVGPGGPFPVEYTCDGAGISPPVEWEAGPSGTKSYALALWHETPDSVKSYWVVYRIPASVTKLPKDSRSIGVIGLNGKRRAEYDPMCSKGPGLKEYHITVYALSAEPQLRPEHATREALLEVIAKTALAEGTLTYAYERKGQR